MELAGIARNIISLATRLLRAISGILITGIAQVCKIGSLESTAKIKSWLRQWPQSPTAAQWLRKKPVVLAQKIRIGARPRSTFGRSLRRDRVCRPQVPWRTTSTDGYTCTACVAHRSPSTACGLLGGRFILPQPSALCGALVSRGFQMKLDIKL